MSPAPPPAREQPLARSTDSETATTNVGARRRRRVIIGTLLVVAAGMAYVMGAALGGLTDGGGPSIGAATQSPQSLAIVTHRFVGTGATTTDWFRAPTDLRAIWEEEPSSDVIVTLEDDSEVRTTIIPGRQGTEPALLPAGTYRLTVETDEPWTLRLVRIVEDQG